MVSETQTHISNALLALGWSCEERERERERERKKRIKKNADRPRRLEKNANDK